MVEGQIADKVSVTICGDGGCGKSSITLRLVRSQWTEDYDPTIEDSYSVTRTIDGLAYHLSLTDTAGQEEYRGLWAASNLHSDAFLLVYDITSAQSLEGLTWFLEMISMEADNRQENNNRILREKGTKARGRRADGWRSMPIVIIAGNKCDLKEGRVVSSKIGWEWARSRGCGFMETSAREMVNVEETFAWIVRKVVEGRQSDLGITMSRKHTPQASMAGLQSYGIPAQMSASAQLQSQPQPQPQPQSQSYTPGHTTKPSQTAFPPPPARSFNEKSEFDFEKVPWWKRMLKCSCFG